MTFRFSGQIERHPGEAVIFAKHILEHSRQTPAPESELKRWRVSVFVPFTAQVNPSISGDPPRGWVVDLLRAGFVWTIVTDAITRADAEKIGEVIGEADA